MPSMLSRVLGAAILLSSTGLAFAEDAAPQPSAAAEKKSDGTAAPVDMQQPAIGDHWSYDVTDEITGDIKERRTLTITDISPKEITERSETDGKSEQNIFVYDLSWNAVRTNAVRFSPHDGTGVQLPLEVGKSWKFRGDRLEPNGAIWKRVGESRVAGKETVTTKAGQFETFVIETKFTVQNVQDPARKNDGTIRTWYSPAVDHWIKRNIVFRVSGHVLTNNTIVLTAYGRKKT